MRPTAILRAGGDVPLGRYGKYLGGWGNLGSPKQKIITYGIAPNRQNPFAGAGHDAIFNSWRRFRSQVLYVVPPFILAYYVIETANKSNHYWQSKEGRALTKDEEE